MKLGEYQNEPNSYEKDHFNTYFLFWIGFVERLRDAFGEP